LVRISGYASLCATSAGNFYHDRPRSHFVILEGRIFTKLDQTYVEELIVGDLGDRTVNNGGMVVWFWLIHWCGDSMVGLGFVRGEIFCDSCGRVGSWLDVVLFIFSFIW
jgi:hypothetical protein